MLHCRGLNLEHVQAIAVLARRLAVFPPPGRPAASYSSLPLVRLLGYVVHDVQNWILISALQTDEVRLARLLAYFELGGVLLCGAPA